MHTAFGFFLLSLVIGVVPALGQDTITTAPLPNALPEVAVQAFQLNRAAAQVPASLGLLDSNTLQRFGNSGIVNAVNTIPGVRMEERSPGSYRLAIRGSSLRAPFGVRNVKIYYNGIPLTDPGGNTYLNQLGYYNIAGLELIKGPGSSLYGAGTGGVALISSLPEDTRSGVMLEATAGSYGLYNLAAELRTVDSPGLFRSVFRYQHLQSDGYREQTAMRRDILSWDGRAQLRPGIAVSGHFYYTDLQYQTPGALTKTEFDANPRSARPRSGASPGAREAGAAIRQKAFLAGVSVDYHPAAHWTYAATFYTAHTLFENPTIRNYSRSTEPHGGGRTSLSYEKNGLLITGGVELQLANNSVQTYSNRLALPDTLQSDDALGLRNGFAFLQAGYELKRWLITAGLSVSAFRLRYERLNTGVQTTRDINNTAAPRAAVSYRLATGTTVYTSLASGFSPPSSSELSPSGGVLNASLKPESGLSYELGLHHKGALSYNIAAYYFRLRQAIVQRRDAAGGDYYINSGGTRQAGLELDLRYRWNDSWSVSAAYSYQHFRYAEFAQVDQDYSGNAMPGISPNNGFAAVDWTSPFGLYVRISGTLTDFMYLDDGNRATQAGYGLLSARAGYRFRTGQYCFEVFGGGDNLTDAKYSAGPDINAFGGRYYNAAPGVSCYAGLRLERIAR